MTAFSLFLVRRTHCIHSTGERTNVHKQLVVYELNSQLVVTSNNDFWDVISSCALSRILIITSKTVERVIFSPECETKKKDK